MLAQTQEHAQVLEQTLTQTKGQMQELKSALNQANKLVLELEQALKQERRRNKKKGKKSKEQEELSQGQEKEIKKPKEQEESNIQPTERNITTRINLNTEDCEGSSLKIMYQEVCDFGICKHFQILGYLCKDLMDFLTNRGYADAATDTFRQAFIRAMGRDRFYWENCCPIVLGDPCQLEMPTGFAQLAVNQCWSEIFCDLQDLKPCDCKNQEEAPPTLPAYLGWCFFREYAPAFGSFLNGYEIDEAQPKKDKILALADHLLGNAVPDKLHWYPVILYVSILLCVSDFELIPAETEVTEDNIF